MCIFKTHFIWLTFSLLRLLEFMIYELLLIFEFMIKLIYATLILHLLVNLTPNPIWRYIYLWMFPQIFST